MDKQKGRMPDRLRIARRVDPVPENRDGQMGNLPAAGSCAGRCGDRRGAARHGAGRMLYLPFFAADAAAVKRRAVRPDAAAGCGAALIPLRSDQSCGVRFGALNRILNRNRFPRWRIFRKRHCRPARGQTGKSALHPGAWAVENRMSRPPRRREEAWKPSLWKSSSV